MATDARACWQGAGFLEGLQPALDAKDLLFPMPEVHEGHWNEVKKLEQFSNCDK